MVDGQTGYLEYIQGYNGFDGTNYPYLASGDYKYYAVIAEVAYNRLDVAGQFDTKEALQNAIRENWDTLKEDFDVDNVEEFLKSLHYVQAPEVKDKDGGGYTNDGTYWRAYLDSAPMTIYGFLEKGSNGCAAEGGELGSGSGYDLYLENLTLRDGEVTVSAQGHNKFATTTSTKTTTKHEGSGLTASIESTTTETTGTAYEGRLEYSYEDNAVVKTVETARKVDLVLGSSRTDTTTITRTERERKPDPDPDPEPPSPEEDIPDIEVPLGEIPEEDIPDGEIPLSDVPQTGDRFNMQMSAAAAAVSGACIAYLLFSGRKGRGKRMAK